MSRLTPILSDYLPKLDFYSDDVSTMDEIMTRYMESIIPLISDHYRETKIILSNLIPSFIRSTGMLTIAVSNTTYSNLRSFIGESVGVKLVINTNFMKVLLKLQDDMLPEVFSNVLIFLLFHEAHHIHHLHLSYNIAMSNGLLDKIYRDLPDNATETTVRDKMMKMNDEYSVEHNLAMDISINEHLSEVLDLDFMTDIHPYIGGIVVKNVFSDHDISKHNIITHGGHRYYLKLIRQLKPNINPPSNHYYQSSLTLSDILNVVNDTSNLERIEDKYDQLLKSKLLVQDDTNLSDQELINRINQLTKPLKHNLDSRDVTPLVFTNNQLKIRRDSIIWNKILTTIGSEDSTTYSIPIQYNKYELISPLLIPQLTDIPTGSHILICIDTSQSCMQLFTVFEDLMKSCIEFKNSLYTTSRSLTIDVLLFAVTSKSLLDVSSKIDLFELDHKLGAGTRLRNIQDYVNSKMTHYDEYVVMTDGYDSNDNYGKVLDLPNPSKWTWIMPKNYSDMNIPDKSRRIILTDLNNSTW